MQEELNQIYKNKVWTLVPLLSGKISIGSKWVFRNKKDKHVARMEAIRIFLAFGIYMNFIVFQMDVKSAFLNGKLKEEVYVKQPLGFESSEFPNYVCKLDKVLYGLKQAPRACSSVKTPMVPPNNLGPDLAGKPVNKTSYRGMIGSLMYLKGTPTLGLYYPKCSGFDLKGYSNSDYAGWNMDRKITSVKAEYVVAAGCCDNLCAYDCYVNIMCTGRLLGAYNLRVATPRALVHAGDKTSGDARSWYMISGDAKSWVVIVCIYSLSYSTIIQLFEILA
ncbi:retrovirus-related pol polyprotein from transposon TNT 1-94 [Tanacetum coccineum]